MERVQVLIDKLSTQQATNQSPVQLLVTVQLLHQELIRLQETKAIIGGSNKVAVILPTIFPSHEAIQEAIVISNTLTEKQEEKQIFPLIEPKEEKPVFQQQSFFDSPKAEAPIPDTTVSENYILKKPEVLKPIDVKEEVKAPQNPALAFDVIVETPTLSYRQPQKEIHEMIGGQEASLNDKLKEEKIELAHVLKEAPIKDLRKGIGVNDMFLFINELFRGDESLYEKSIRTINAFHILPEAEYWINRELKMRLAWNDNKEVVQHFYHLVRRRFS